MSKRTGKMIAWLLSFALIFSVCDEYMWGGISEVYAAGITDNGLAAPSGVSWKTGYKATARWNAVDRANYYEVTVRVYHNSVQVGGDRITGTGDTEIDIQQEIHSIVNEGNGSYGAVQVKVSIRAAKIVGNEIYSGANTSDSSELTYSLGGVEVLAVPSDITLSDDYVGSWNPVNNVSWYHARVRVESDGQVYVSESVLDYITVYSTELDKTKNKITHDFSSFINKKCKDFQLEGKTVKVSISVQAFSYSEVNPDYVSSDYSGWTNGKEYVVPNASVLEIPSNVSLGTDYVGTWDVVDNVSWYYACLRITDGSNITVYGANGGIYSNVAVYTFYLDKETNKITYDFSTYINMACKDLKLEGKTVEVAISVQAFSYTNKNPNYLASEYSDWSNCVTYTVTSASVLEAPSNIAFTDDYIGSWDEVKNVSWYCVRLLMDDGNKEIVYGTIYSDRMVVYTSNVDRNTNRITYDFTTYIDKACKVNDFEKREVNVSISVQSFSYANSNPDYVSSEFSDWTNRVTFHTEPDVSNIILSPEAPIIAVGNSYSIGKTIKPKNARYTSIEWRSDHTSVATVDNAGLLTGVSSGTARIYAKIGNIEKNVSVIVYQPESNIGDAGNKKTILASTAKIIDNLLNAEDVDLSNTNIDEADVARIKEVLKQGILAGEKISTDLVVNKRTQISDDVSRKIKNRYGDASAIAMIYDIAIEINQKKTNGSINHIGDITQLNKGITLEMEFPTGLPELKAGYRRDLRIVRLHNNEMTELGSQISNHKIEFESDKFSDFLVVYTDVYVGGNASAGSGVSGSPAGSGSSSGSSSKGSTGGSTGSGSTSGSSSNGSAGVSTGSGSTGSSSSAGSTNSSSGSTGTNAGESSNAKETGAVANEKSAATAKAATAKVGNIVKVSDAKYEVTGKTTVSFSALTTKAKTFVIPDMITINGKQYKVTAIKDNAFKNNRTITKIVIGNNITTIGKNAFRGCTALKSVSIGKKVKSIGKLAFYGDKKLKTLVVRSAKLTKSGVQKSLKGSKVTTMKLSGSAAKAKAEKYAKIFKKSNSGRSITVK